MKHFTLTTALLLFFVTFISKPASAQDVILEQDGANNEFVVADWTIDAPAFATMSKVNIEGGKQGRLQINNTIYFKNITVELHFSQPNSIAFDVILKDSTTGVLTKTGVISDATSTPNKAVINFNNATALQLKSMQISNPTITAGIIYLKITGEATTTAIKEQQQVKFEVIAQPNQINIAVENNYQLNLYNVAGQLQGKYQLHKGKNSISNSTKGILFLILSDSNGIVVSRDKIMR